MEKKKRENLQKERKKEFVERKKERVTRTMPRSLGRGLIYAMQVKVDIKGLTSLRPDVEGRWSGSSLDFKIKVLIRGCFYFIVHSHFTFQNLLCLYFFGHDHFDLYTFLLLSKIFSMRIVEQFLAL